MVDPKLKSLHANINDPWAELALLPDLQRERFRAPLPKSPLFAKTSRTILGVLSLLSVSLMNWSRTSVHTVPGRPPRILPTGPRIHHPTLRRLPKPQVPRRIPRCPRTLPMRLLFLRQIGSRWPQTSPAVSGCHCSLPVIAPRTLTSAYGTRRTIRPVVQTTTPMWMQVQVTMLLMQAATLSPHAPGTKNIWPVIVGPASLTSWVLLRRSTTVVFMGYQLCPSTSSTTAVSNHS